VKRCCCGRPLPLTAVPFNQQEEGQSMKPVATGVRVSVVLSDDLVTFFSSHRAESKDQRRRLYAEAVPGHGYFLWLYPLDRRTAVHAVRKNNNALGTIRQIQEAEWNSW
jgi:hypothetical protein